MSGKPLRILHTESSTGWGGQELRTLTEARGMLDRGHQVSLLTPPSAAIYQEALNRLIPAVALPIERKNLAGLFATAKWLIAHGRQFDVVNTHSSTDAWLTALASSIIAGAPPMVRTRHVSTRIHPGWRTRWLYRTASAHVVTTGEALRQQLVQQNGIDARKITSVRTGIDLSLFTPADQSLCRRKLGIDNRPALGIVATLRDWKGHDYLLDAWFFLRTEFPGWQLLIIGDGPQRGRLEQRVKEHKANDSIRFVGNQHNVAVWLNSLDLFTLPSFGDEGVPQGIMQAMACGLAVVSTPVGAIEEAVQRDRTGLIVEPKNSAALSDALALLMRNGNLRRTLGNAGLDYARRHFALESMLDKMEGVFRGVCAGNRPLQ